MIALAAGCWLCAVIFGPPIVVGWLATGTRHGAIAAAALAYVAYLLFTVRRLRIEAGGLRFVRVLGAPKLIPWDQLRRVTIAERAELVVHGWLWPLFPPREMTPSLSSEQHVRFDWGDGRFCFYPPRDARALLAEIEKRRSPPDDGA